jgi:hypothetical protein
MPVLPPSCRRPCRLSRLLAGGLAVATDGQGRSPAGLGPGHQDLPSNGHEAGTMTITYSDRVRRSLYCKSAPCRIFADVRRCECRFALSAYLPVLREGQALMVAGSRGSPGICPYECGGTDRGRCPSCHWRPAIYGSYDAGGHPHICRTPLYRAASRSGWPCRARRLMRIAGPCCRLQAAYRVCLLAVGLGGGAPARGSGMLAAGVGHSGTARGRAYRACPGWSIITALRVFITAHRIVLSLGVSYVL